MVFNLVVSGMYLEMSEGFINQGIQFKKEENLNSETDIPEIVLTNIRFTQFAGAVIFSISSIEAFVNHIIFELLNKDFDLSIFETQDNFETIESNISDFTNSYKTVEKKEKLFKQEKLSKKINKLYKCFDLQLISERPEKAYRKVWEDFIVLQNIRNELIHPKPEFINSNMFLKFINLKESDFKSLLQSPIILRHLLFEDTPLFQTNLGHNSIIKRYILEYKANVIFEHVLLTGTEYNFENVKKWETRWKDNPLK